MKAYKISTEKRLKRILGRLYKKDRTRYEILMKKIEEIGLNPHHYKPLSHDMTGVRRVHIFGSFVLVFEIDEKKGLVRFLDLDHHDKIYRKRF